ncbi:putative efflux ABC transporter, permease domain containing protein [Monocercomonoides exilis]|uniref:putative efflux ABC transporter, permease domain containing protein n=1 Tax=Monocercomonoides exilis TaxID=2049356 RepID=UPI003559F691|nr:putative efflux ABC transporter, permease domain containing protein [Monocercomonoides exilis]|eukprot:MONOS_13083.1-p1 / transcript=MONOS_13083.1 / gene=MONOS_13083 / organism=Monocercomonoides_exilis_PA203 / gene_product=efflux ABC transporter, permease domain containing protein / transcript_product=efflux ABC transporter, permease domain containing protein / location=Mono_scaffold00776:8146-11597(-) / protein_length=990 / sequence_SO=supercontig / SO=protein_coding / is_pseudo=false
MTLVGRVVITQYPKEKSLFVVLVKYALNRLLEAGKYLQNFTVPFEIAEVQKRNNDLFRRTIFYAEIDNIWEHIVEYLPRSVLEIVGKEQFQEANLNDNATELDCNLQVPRNKTYLYIDSSIATRKLNSWSMNILYALDFAELYARISPISNSFSSFDSIILLAVGIGIVIILAVTILIIYSQIQRSVDGRAYELGLMRVHGMSRFGVVMLILIQALTFAAPGIIIGILGSQGINEALIIYISKKTGYRLGVMLSLWSVVITILVVLAATLVASFFPIKTALSTKLHDSIDTQHTNTSTVLITIERSDSNHSSFTLLVDGLILTVIGACVYLLFPLSLVSRNMVLMIILLIGLVICVMTALVLICVNFEYIFEAIVTVVLLFWEKKAVRKLALTNLSLHRLRNRGTTIMFALIMCFLFSMDVMINTLIETIMATECQNLDCDLRIAPVLEGDQYASVFKDYENWNGSVFFPPPLIKDTVSFQGIKMKDLGALQSLLDKYKDIIEAYAYKGCDLWEQQGGSEVNVMVTNRGRTHQNYFELAAVSPYFKEVTDEKVWGIESTLNDKKRKTGDDVIKQMYADYFDSTMVIVPEGFKKQLGTSLGERYVLKKNLSPKASFYLPYCSNTIFNEMDKDYVKKMNENADGKSNVISFSSFFKNVTIGGFASSIPFSSYQNKYDDMPISYLPISFPLMSEVIDNISFAFALSAYDDLRVESIEVKYKKVASPSRTEEFEDDLILFQSNRTTSSSTFFSSTNNVDSFFSSKGASNKCFNFSTSDERVFNSGEDGIEQDEANCSTDDFTRQDFKSVSSFDKQLGSEALIQTDNELSLSSSASDNIANYHVSTTSKKTLDRTYSLTINILHIVFAICAFFMSFLGECSLVAAMSSNVLSSKKDYGMMRSMGMTQFQTRRVYIEEAFILVMAASVMGMVSGMLLSYMLSSQITVLLSARKVAFYFPYLTLIELVFISLLMGYLSTSAPLSYLRHMQIADCMRS